MSGQFPRDLNLVTVQFGPFVDSVGNPMEGLTVRIETSNNIIHSSGAAILASQKISLRTDRNGVANAVLIATDSDNIKNPNFNYKVTLDTRITRNNEMTVMLPKSIQGPINFGQLYHHFNADGQVYSYAKEALISDILEAIEDRLPNGSTGLTQEEKQQIIDDVLTQIGTPWAELTEAQIQTVLARVKDEIGTPTAEITPAQLQEIVDHVLTQIDVPSGELTEAQLQDIVGRVVTQIGQMGSTRVIVTSSTFTSANGRKQQFVATADATMDFAALATDDYIDLLVNPATYTLTWTNVNWQNGTAAQITASKLNRVLIENDGGVIKAYIVSN